MTKHQIILSMVIVVTGQLSVAAPPPASPTDPLHPGSKIYSFGFQQKNLSCLGRSVAAVLPDGKVTNAPVVVFGHGQALDLKHYQATFEHLAKKGVAVLFPTYDQGFFDQDWTRMGSDYVEMTECALTQLSTTVSSDSVVYSGHSKGAYVASIAAGLAAKKNSKAKPKAIVIFAAAGFNRAVDFIEPSTSLTVVYSDSDTIVGRNFSEDIYRAAPSLRKQLITLKSYTATTPPLKADHMWPVTEPSFFGGGPENSFHYFGSWKWLTAAALDLSVGAKFADPYLYGDEAYDKGISGLADDFVRSW